MRSTVASVLAVLSTGQSNRMGINDPKNSNDKDAQDTMRHPVYMFTIVRACLNG